MKEGQTQEPVGGMKTKEEIYDIFCPTPTVDNIYAAMEFYAKQFKTPLDVEALANDIISTINESFDKEEAYSVVKQKIIEVLKSVYAASPQSSSENDWVDSFSEQPNVEGIYWCHDGTGSFQSTWKNTTGFGHNSVKKWKRKSAPQSSTEEEKELWEEVANVLYGFEMGRRFDMNELLSTYKITKR